MAFLTLAEEDTLVASLVATGRVAADTVGVSALGNPIRLLRLGTGPSVLLLTGCQHGPEKAGREALLNLASRLSTTSDQDELDFLDTYSLLVMPTCNPDGVHLNERENGNGINLNGDHLTLASQETRAVAEVLSTYRPALVVDIHQGEIGSDDAQLLHPTAPGVHSVVVGRSQDAVAGIATYLAGQSLTPGVWPGSTNGQVLRNCAGLRNLASVIAECDSTTNETAQTAICTAVAEGALLYARTNATGLLADVATADATEVDLVLPSGPVTPSPVGYRLPHYPGVHVTGFGLPVLAGGVVALTRPVVGYLFDPDGTPVKAGTRLSSLTVPLLRYSHTVTYLTPGSFPLTPGGDMLLVEVKGGSGGGGGATATGSGQTSGGGGGGGGEYRSGWVPSAAGTVVVGAGGDGGTGQGGNGEASSFAGITAAGGLGGFHRAASSLAFDTTPGGVGGSTGTGGDFTIPGGPGGAYVGSAGRACGGQGGDSHWGGGGRASTGTNHEWGRANGGGGAGAGNHANQAAQPGRSGAPGAVRVHVYVEE